MNADDPSKVTMIDTQNQYFGVINEDVTPGSVVFFNDVLLMLGNETYSQGDYEAFILNVFAYSGYQIMNQDYAAIPEPMTIGLILSSLIVFFLQKIQKIGGHIELARF